MKLENGTRIEGQIVVIYNVRGGENGTRDYGCFIKREHAERMAKGVGWYTEMGSVDEIPLLKLDSGEVFELHSLAYIMRHRDGNMEYSSKTKTYSEAVENSELLDALPEHLREKHIKALQRR